MEVETPYQSDRTRLAFLIAPLWVPIATAACTVHMFPHAEQVHWIFISTIIGAMFGYGGVWIIGFPAFVILRKMGFFSCWMATSIGLVVAMFAWHVFLVLFALLLGNGLKFALHQLATSSSWALTLAVGTLGSVVGATLWLIARPDKIANAPSELTKL